MYVWPAHFPPACPPAHSSSLAGTVFRFINGSVPADRDFVSYYAKAKAEGATIVTGGGAIFSAVNGSLNIIVAAPFALAALGGLLIGLLLGKKISGLHTQLIFSIFTLIIAISLLIKGALTLNL